MREMQGNWRDIFMAFRVALDPKKLLLCFLGLALSFFLTMLLLMMVGDTSIWGWKGSIPGWFKTNLAEIYSHPNPLVCPMFTLLLVVVNSIFWSYFGGAVTRLAALQVTKDESLELDKAMKFGQKRYSSYFWSVGACVAGFLFFLVVVAIVSLFGRIPWHIGEFLSIVLMVLYPLAVLAGFLMTLIAIGTVFGAPLFYPAISAEGTDAFDAISRGFGYVYTRPWHYIAYQLVALGHGIVSVGFVYLFGWLMLAFTDASGFSMGENFHRIRNVWNVAPGGLLSLSGYIYAFWFSIVAGLILSYGLSYFLSAQTVIYFLLRKKVDGIEVNEVYEEKEEMAAPVAAPPAAVPATPVQATTPAPPAPAAAPSASEPPAPAAPPPPPSGSGS